MIIKCITKRLYKLFALNIMKIKTAISNNKVLLIIVLKIRHVITINKA